MERRFSGSDIELPKRIEEETFEGISHLHPVDQLIIGLRLGVPGLQLDVAHKKRGYSYQKIAEALGLKPRQVRLLEEDAFRELRFASGGYRVHAIEEIVSERKIDEILTRVQMFHRPPARLINLVEAAEVLTPELIAHLKSHCDDLNKLNWQIFEHLVGEFLAAHGFEDVRLVGRDPRTSADIYAACSFDPLGTKLRFFVEVKRHRNAVGIEIINEVLGAMLTERSRFGWHAALIVSTGGFKQMHNYTPLELSLRGVELKDREDLLMWLDGYRPNKNGLWLPDPKRTVPEELIQKQSLCRG